jgi:hypothetical protein
VAIQRSSQFENFEGIAEVSRKGIEAGPSKTAGAVSAPSTTGKDARFGRDSPSKPAPIA